MKPDSLRNDNKCIPHVLSDWRRKIQISKHMKVT